MLYDNTGYWQKIHQDYGGQLRAVGWPTLSEAFNELKYQSEAASLQKVIGDVLSSFPQRQSLSYLDIGAGTGFWTALIYHWLTEHGFSLEATALDISSQALEGLQQRYPWVEPVLADLKIISPQYFAAKYDLVTAVYCLHHLVQSTAFINGVRFAANSVKQDGYLIIIDPILTLPYSTFDVIDFATYQGNGICRHLYYLDDLVFAEGLRRVHFVPAVSFVLNGNIQAYTKIQYDLHRWIWSILAMFYRSERTTQRLARWVRSIDSYLKCHNQAFSGSIAVYQKGGK